MPKEITTFTQEDVKIETLWEIILKTLLIVMGMVVNIGANKSCVMTGISVVSKVK